MVKMGNRRMIEERKINSIIKSYDLNSTFIVDPYLMTAQGRYNANDDVIILNPRQSNREFILSLLHEICHALDSKRLGHKKFMKKYNQAGQVAVNTGKDFYDNNKWEKRAERFAQREIKKHEQKII